MYADSLCCGNHGLGVGVRFEPSDIFCHRAGEQFDILRQITDMTAERVRSPLIEGGAINTNIAAYRLPYSDQQPDQGRFPRATWSDDAETLTGFEFESNILDDNFGNTGRRPAHGLYC